MGPAGGTGRRRARIPRSVARPIRTAIATLQPLVNKFDPASSPTGVPKARNFLPDAIEALVQLGRFAEAEPLVEALERNGQRLDRPWMLAAGARGRSMLLAATGDLDAASAAAERALAVHDRLPMPFERARTQLLLGQLQRRQRRKESGVDHPAGRPRRVREAAHPVVGRSRAGRTGARRRRTPRKRSQLTPSEQRVAELAASGIKNRDVATTLFISPKTVEANLARIYRKLGIRSRAELGRYMSKAGE